MKISREVQIGAAVVLSAAILYVGQRYFRDLPIFAGTHTFSTIATDAAGIIPGNAVRINGVYVGSVTGVQIDGGAARVYFTVSDNIDLPHGTTAILGGFAFVGDVRLDLVLGPPDTTYHSPGDIIPENHDESLLASFTAAAPNLLDRLDTLLAGTNQSVAAAHVLLDDQGSDLRSSLRSVGTTAKSLSALLDAESANLSATLDDIRMLAHALTGLAKDSLAHTIEGLNVVVIRLQKNLDALERTTLALNSFLDGVNSGQGTLGKLATDETLYNEATQAAAALRRLLEDLERNPRKYLKEIRLVDIF